MSVPHGDVDVPLTRPVVILVGYLCAGVGL